MQKKIIYNLNALKFLLALLIIVCHVFIIDTLGHFCVCTFFMISGYLLESKFLRNKGYHMKDVLRSIAMMMPAYFLMLVVFIALQYVGLSKFNLPSTLAHFLLMQVWFEQFTAFLLNSPSWFLSAYFGLLLFSVVLYKLKGWKRVALVLVSIISWFCLGSLIENKHWWFYQFPFAHMLEFYIGMVLFHLPDKKKNFIKHYSFVFQWISLFTIVITPYVIYRCVPNIWLRETWIFIPFSIIVVACFIFTDNSNTFLSRLYHKNFIQWGGGVSLQIFLYHFFIVRIFYYMLRSMNLWLVFPVVMVLVLCFAFVMQKYYERPLLKKMGWL